MSGAQSISTRRAYGVQRVCRVWARPRSSVYARRQAPRDCTRGHRRGPVGAAPDEVLVVHIRRVLEASPFHGEGYRKVWAKLRVEGIRTSKERVRRLMREHHLQAPHRVGQAHGPKAHDGTITTETPDVMWGNRHDDHGDRGRGNGRRVRGRRSLHDRVHRSACGQARNPLRGLGAHPPGCPRTLRRYRRRCRPRAAAASRPRVELLGRRFPAGGRLLRHRQLPEFRAGARRERRRGAFHPHTEGESVVGAELRNHRGGNSAWPCSRSSGHTTNSGCWRNTTIEVPPRSDATSSGWTRQRRSEYRQTTVQELWGATPIAAISTSNNVTSAVPSFAFATNVLLSSQIFARLLASLVNSLCQES